MVEAGNVFRDMNESFLEQIVISVSKETWSYVATVIDLGISDITKIPLNVPLY